MKKISDGIIGAIIGDALGVPFEFKERSELVQNPATDMVGFGTWNEPPGTWSDDSSLMLCLVDSLISEYNLINIAQLFIRWKEQAIWTAHNEVFDIGDTTRNSINELKNLILNNEHDQIDLLKLRGNEQDNGNGSLMRILPLLYHTKNLNIKDTFETIWSVSALTHKHIRAALCCFIYLQLAKHLLVQSDKHLALNLTIKDTRLLINEINLNQTEKEHIAFFISQTFLTKEANEIKSSAYVVDTLEASLWCFFNTNNYTESVLKAVNLGEDTDTVSSITGGLSGIYYGVDTIPTGWSSCIFRIKEIEKLCQLIELKYNIN